MKITGLDVKVEKGEQASDFLEMMQGYDYGLLYYLSEVILTALEGKTVTNLQQLTEARLFSEDKELHVFQNEKGWQAVLCCETEGAEYIEEYRPLSRNFQGAGKHLGVRRYISYDEDGQAYIALTRLYAVKGEDQNGPICWSTV